MKKRLKLIYILGIACLIIVNICIFIAVNKVPIHWMQEEMLQKTILWSANGFDDYKLHMGLQLDDFKKLFHSRNVDGIFRVRQFSYFFDMLSFKFWQYAGIGFLRNYSLIILHLINVLLLGYLVYLLTKSRAAAVCAGILFLNSGTALATLLFPFRSAKILVLLFFLIDWILLIKDRIPFGRASNDRHIVFFFTMLLAFFTDEFAFFLFPFLFFYIAINESKQDVNWKRIVRNFCFTLVLFGALVYRTYQFARRITTEEFYTSGYTDHLSQLIVYFKDIRTLFDALKSFFAYFLRHNFGYWDFSIIGVGAFISFVLLLFICFRNGTKQRFKLPAAILALIFVKMLLLPKK